MKTKERTMSELKESDLKNSSRREFVKKAAYVAPIVLTLPAIPSFASSGSSIQTDVEERD